MGRSKRTPFAPWETTKPDGIENRFIRLGNSFLMHDAIRGLSPGAFKVLSYMKIEAAGKKEFEFPQSVFLKFTTKPAFGRALEELVSAGFVEVVANNYCIRKPNIYRFSDRWKT